MKRGTGIVVVVALGTCGLAMAASIRNGGDFAAGQHDRVIWADPFDYYSQWAYANDQTWTDTKNPPLGGLHNGYYPPGDPNGSLPGKPPACGYLVQTSPALSEMARAMWITTDRHKGYLGNSISTPAGVLVDTGDFEANVDGGWCSTGQFSTTREMYATANYNWKWDRTAMTMFQHSFKDRIQAINPNANAVAGTDEHPLVLTFQFMPALTPVKDNFYVELSMDGDHAPTDYVWRGHYPGEETDPESCPQGPYPIICQQAREMNSSNSEAQWDVDWLNANCPAPKTKFWKSIAFGYMAIMDKDPCSYAEQGGNNVHIPYVEHYAYFDGNIWRQIREGREFGLAGPFPLPWDYAAGTAGCTTNGGVCTGKGGFDPNMRVGSTNSTGFSYPPDGSVETVYIKIITNYILIYVSGTKPTNTYNGVAIKRAWPDDPTNPDARAGFNMISIGVGPGCELDKATGECKAGTARHALTYSRAGDGYERGQVDSMVLYDGELVYVNTTTGACCTPDGECRMTQESTCKADGGSFAGVGVPCNRAPRCCPALYGDTDKDLDVDMADFAKFQRCVTTGGDLIPAGCECLDLDSDGDIDGDDQIHFNACATGEGVLGNPNCRNW